MTMSIISTPSTHTPKISGSTHLNHHHKTSWTTPIDRLLSHLRGVRKAGPSQWQALCPAHHDQTPSLAVREKDDGALLVKCFAECETKAVLEAVGLSLKDLYPDNPPGHRQPPERRPFSATALLRAIAREAGVVQIAAADLAHGEALSDKDYARLATAARRIRHALRAGGLA